MILSLVFFAGVILVGMVLAYLIGAIPTGVITSKALLGIDLRKHGSGNVGTTNAMRTGGFRAGAMVCVLDILKGVVGTLTMYLVILAARTFFSAQLEIFAFFLDDGRIGFDIAMGIAQVAATFGHMHSPFMGFSGGKGIATSFGGFLVVVPWCAVAALACFVVGCVATRYASIGSLAGASGYLICCIVVYREHIALIAAAIAIFILVFYAHRGNIKRLAHGEERRLSIGSKETVDAERRLEMEGLSEYEDSPVGDEDDVEQGSDAGGEQEAEGGEHAEQENEGVAQGSDEGDLAREDGETAEGGEQDSEGDAS